MFSIHDLFGCIGQRKVENIPTPPHERIQDWNQVCCCSLSEGRISYSAHGDKIIKSNIGSQVSLTFLYCKSLCKNPRVSSGFCISFKKVIGAAIFLLFGCSFTFRLAIGFQHAIVIDIRSTQNLRNDRSPFCLGRTSLVCSFTEFRFVTTAKEGV